MVTSAQTLCWVRWGGMGVVIALREVKGTGGVLWKSRVPRCEELEGGGAGFLICHRPLSLAVTLGR